MNFQLVLPMYLVSAFKLLTYSFFSYVSLYIPYPTQNETDSF